MAILKINPEVNRAIKHQLINNYGVIVSTLAKEFGISSLEHVQKVAENSIEEAKKDWTLNGIPENPNDYIWNSIIESSNKLFCRKVNYLKKYAQSNKINIQKFHFDFPKKNEAVENKIEILFSIFDRRIESSTRKYLVLNLLCGFSYSSLGRIFEKNESLLEKEVYGQKKKIADGHVILSLPNRRLSIHKLKEINEVVRSIFNKGYNCNNKEKTLFPELCHSAILLANL
ncbi:MAG: hypothetical protein ACRENO_08855, partial [Thermodesulfobacteriota bacterium]